MNFEVLNMKMLILSWGESSVSMELSQQCGCPSVDVGMNELAQWHFKAMPSIRA